MEWCRNPAPSLDNLRKCSFMIIMLSFSEQEKARRWVEIKERQQILMKEASEAQMPAHIDQIMRSGFTMNDIKGILYDTLKSHILLKIFFCTTLY